jgi:hypothetical protein
MEEVEGQGIMNNTGEVVFPMQLNKDYYVVTANDLIRGKQIMSEREAKLLMIAIAQVAKDDSDLKTFTTTVPELAEFLGISTKSLYKDLEALCTDLLKRIVKVKIGEEKGKKGWEVFQWVNKARFENGMLTIRLSDEIKPFGVELAKQYPQYQLKTALTFRSYYSTRLYQLLKCDVGENHKSEWSFTCESLRDFFQTGKKYKTNWNLLEKTIKPAINELNTSPYVHIWGYTEPKARSKGAPLTGVKFHAKLFDTQEEKERFVESLKPAPLQTVGETVSPAPSTEAAAHQRQAAADKKNELDSAKTNPLWKFALTVAKRKKKLKVRPERYAVGILRNWEAVGFKTPEELVENGELSADDIKPKHSFDLGDF